MAPLADEEEPQQVVVHHPWVRSENVDDTHGVGWGERSVDAFSKVRADPPPHGTRAGGRRWVIAPNDGDLQVFGVVATCEKSVWMRQDVSNTLRLVAVDNN